VKTQSVQTVVKQKIRNTHSYANMKEERNNDKTQEN